MKALLLFSRYSTEAHKAFPADLALLLNNVQKGIQVHTALLEDLLFAIDEERIEVMDTVNQCSLADYNIVYFRHWSDAQGSAMAAARFCTLKKVPFVDSEVYRSGSANKITQYMNLYEAGIPFPKTLIAPSDQLLAKYEAYGFSFPLVIKSASGSRGVDNFAVYNESELRKVLAANLDLTFVMQSFIPNEGDYRVIVMGDSVPMVIERKSASKSTHLNNTSQGGRGRMVPPTSLPPEVITLSLRAAQFFECQIAGVDMVRSLADGRFYCFEVNRSPQIEHSSFETQKAMYLTDYLKYVAAKKLA